MNCFKKTEIDSMVGRTCIAWNENLLNSGWRRCLLPRIIEIEIAVALSTELIQSNPIGGPGVHAESLAGTSCNAVLMPCASLPHTTHKSSVLTVESAIATVMSTRAGYNEANKARITKQQGAMTP